MSLMWALQGIGARVVNGKWILRKLKAINFENTGKHISIPTVKVITVVGDTIPILASHVELNPNANLILTSAPTIPVGVKGQRIRITASNGEAHTVTLQDTATLTGSLLRLGAAKRVIGAKTILDLYCDGTEWIETFYFDGAPGSFKKGDRQTIPTGYLVPGTLGAFWTAPVAGKVIEARERHGTPATGADTLDIVKAASGTAISGGTSVIASVFAINSAANTPVTKGPSATPANAAFAAGDSLGTKLGTGDGTDYVGSASIVVEWT